ncbi:MAG: (Fe-S)-binding protein [Desulfobacterales bacterium]|jgi:Fe-S oxidoreductase|nr:(Fe-S)-binding protein [Desulfobacterales bacterium]
MRSSKTLVSQALKTIAGNLARTGDPLGLKTIYWTRWAKDLHLPRRGDVLLYTARMYQMLPYVVRATDMAAAAKPVLPMLKIHALARMAEMAGALAADPLLRLQGGAEHEIRRRGEAALKGMVTALAAAGIRPAYLHEAEPYSGVLLHDLGMENEVPALARSVYRRLKASGARTIVTTDPHTTFMLREIYPRYVPGFDLDVRHYLQVLAGAASPERVPSTATPPRRVVFHDSCVMARDLGIVQEPRTVLERIGTQIVEPESRGQNTACCGGPVEYGFADLSRSISAIRARELAAGATDVVVTCPICLINLMKHEKSLGIRVWDLGERLGMPTGQPVA